MGILLEADYKGIVRGEESIIEGLRKMYSSTRAGASANPLDDSQGKDTKPAESGAGQLTYELMNRDSGMSFDSMKWVCCLTVPSSYPPSSRV
jgi:hypothetical protein